MQAVNLPDQLFASSIKGVQELGTFAAVIAIILFFLHMNGVGKITNQPPPGSVSVEFVFFNQGAHVPGRIITQLLKEGQGIGDRFRTHPPRFCKGGIGPCLFICKCINETEVV